MSVDLRVNIDRHHIDDVLDAIIRRVADRAVAAGMTRRRGSQAFGSTYWVEISGRGRDGSWYELRVHHKPTEQRVQAGLLAYQPLSRGGRAIEIGAGSSTYEGAVSPDAAIAYCVATITGWLDIVAANVRQGAS